MNSFIPLPCPMCTSELIYVEGTHDLGCPEDKCIFAISFSISTPERGVLWDIRMIAKIIDPGPFVSLLKEIERRNRDNERLAANVPNLPKKKPEKTQEQKLAFRYGLEIEDIYSIKYSTYTLERLAMFYNLTPKAVAKELGISQDNVSRLESRSDVLISTLRHYVHSMGGELSMVAVFPDRPPVLLAGIAAMKAESERDA